MGFNAYDGTETPTSYRTPPSYGAQPGPPPAFDATRPFQAGGPRVPAYGHDPYNGAGRYETPASFGESQAQAGGGRPLPRRVRGGNLAPQLRDPDGFAEPAAPPPADAVAAWEERSAEASRDLFASLQVGWLRGRDEDEGPADGMEEDHDPAGVAAELNFLLDDLVDRVPQIRKVVVLSRDGLVMGKSRGVGREDAEYLAALAAGFHSLAIGAKPQLESGEIRQTLIEMDQACSSSCPPGPAAASRCSARSAPTRASSPTR